MRTPQSVSASWVYKATMGFANCDGRVHFGIRGCRFGMAIVNLMLDDGGGMMGDVTAGALP